MLSSHYNHSQFNHILMTSLNLFFSCNNHTASIVVVRNKKQLELSVCYYSSQKPDMSKDTLFLRLKKFIFSLT